MTSLDASVADSSLWKNRDFLLLLGARIFSLAAVQVINVAIGWEIYETTKNPLNLGLIGLVQFLPAILLTLHTGSVADHADRRTVLVLSYSASAVCAVLLFVTRDLATWGIAPVFVILGLMGAVRAFSFPVAQALLPSVVPMRQLSAAIAGSASANKIALIGGPALGGLLCALGGAAVYSVAAMLMLASTLCAYLMHYRSPPRPRTPMTLYTALIGLKFIASRPALLGAVSLDLFAVLLGGATAMLPAYARDILHVGALGLGFLRCAPAIGAGLSGIYLSRYPLKEGAGQAMLTCVAIFGIATVIFGLSTNFAVAMLALMTLGGADMGSVFVRQTTIQLSTPDEVRGRVSAVNALVLNASNQLGQFESGVMAAWVGTVPSVVLGGVGTLIVTALWSKWFPDLRRIDLSEEGMRRLADHAAAAPAAAE